MRFVIGACGTKFGKTMGCGIWLAQQAWEQKGSLNWWVAPSYRQAENAMELIKSLLPPELVVTYRADMKLVIMEPDGSIHSTIEFKSGDNPDTLRGFGVWNAVIDEAARNMPYASFVSVWTTLTQTNGKLICISTPNGRGWFFDVYQRGGPMREEFDYKYFSIRMPTASNPYVKASAIEDARRALPDDVFRQEYEAEFLADGAGVFRGMSRCMKGGMMMPEPPQRGHIYVMGVDLARSKDYSVITVMDKTRGRNHVVCFDRFNQIAWEIQYLRIIQAAKLYNNAHIIMDTTGIGDPIIQTIQNAGCRVTGYKISGSGPKQQLIEKLRVGIEQAKLSWPDSLRVLLVELENYEYDITEHGTVRYSAPEGKHDDCVISLALAWMGADQEPFIYRWLNQRGI